MKCKNHADINALARCTGCQEAFCENCLVEINGKKYCGDCKIMAVHEQPEIEFDPDKQEASGIPCKEAYDALGIAFISIFLPFLGPLAISKACKAKKILKEIPKMTGEGKAKAALIIGIISVILWIVGFITFLTMTTQK